MRHRIRAAQSYRQASRQALMRRIFAGNAFVYLECRPLREDFREGVQKAREQQPVGAGGNSSNRLDVQKAAIAAREPQWNPQWQWKMRSLWIANP